MKKQFLSVALGTGLFCAAIAAHAQSVPLIFEGFLENATMTADGAFVVDSASGFSEVTLSANYLYYVASDGRHVKTFDPFVAVWNESGNSVGYSPNFSEYGGNPDLVLNLPNGTYTFTVGNWPNMPLGMHRDAGFYADTWFQIPGEVGYFVRGANGEPVSVFPDHADAGFIAGWGSGNYRVEISGHGVSAVPEPETWAMMLAGLGVMGAVARRRKQQ